MDNRPIGVFDSGVGGLTVVRQLMRELKNEEIVYFGDTARVPYGNKSKETVTKFSRQDIRFLLTKDVKAVVIACNTSSSNSLEELKKEFEVPLFGVVEPGVEEAIETTKNKRVGIIGTSATIRSDAYSQLIRERAPEIQVFSTACPLFVPLAEEGWVDNEVTKLTASCYLTEMIENQVDSIVLGCTHYPLLKQCLKETVGSRIKLVDPAYGAAIKVREYLKAENKLRENAALAQHSFYVSDQTEMFDKISLTALGKLYQAEVIDIDQY